MSGVGKGVTTASVGKILSARGFLINPLKIDPYLNVDAGTMNPLEHGEVFVLESGLECDQDMGNYERFLDRAVPAENYMTSGMVYQHVISKERAGGFNGKCVDPVPYISEEILRRLARSVRQCGAEITIIEIGGTAGEYQNAIFIEAARILKLRYPADVIFVLVSFLPVPRQLGEMKTKPTQYAVRTLNSYGVHPDIIIARAERSLDRVRKEKLAFSSNVPVENIISAPDVKSIYDIPINFEKDNLSDTLLRLLHLRPKTSDLRVWRRAARRLTMSAAPVRIGIVGKYFKTGEFTLADAYISVIESLKHAAGRLGRRLEIDWLDAADYEGSGVAARLRSLERYGGLLVPGGFGARGVEGKIATIRYAREKKIPLFGLCYGMQLLVLEYARNVLGLSAAHTTEINAETPDPVIDIMPDQKSHLAAGRLGATMRLGAYPAIVSPKTLAYKLYRRGLISERHRHRYEVNPEYVERLVGAGLVFSGRSPDGRLMEIAELPHDKHPFFLGTQFHPEFKSSLLNPHPLFLGFMRAAAREKQ